MALREALYLPSFDTLPDKSSGITTPGNQINTFASFIISKLWPNGAHRRKFFKLGFKAQMPRLQEQ